MPWNNQAVSLIILTEAATGFSGMFGYSPAVGNGNLIFSVAAAAGTDSFGNSYPQGISSKIGSLSVDNIFSQSASFNPGPLLLYGETAAQSTIFAGGASGNWTAPAGVTSVTATVIGGGGCGGNGNGAALVGGCGGGGAGCAVETFTVVPASNYAYAVGTGAIGGVLASSSTFITGTGGAGTNGVGTGTVGAGGTASGGSSNYTGGNGGPQPGSYEDGTGGGSSAGYNQSGNSGNQINGGAAVPGGGKGGDPGDGATSPGGVPGGGGGGGSGNHVNGTGSPGGNGQVTLNWIGTGGAQALVTSIAAAAGVDGLGNSWVGGLTLDPLPNPAAPGTGCVMWYNGTSLFAKGPSGTIATLATT